MYISQSRFSCGCSILVVLEFENVGFQEGWKTRVLREKPSDQGENQQQTKYIHGTRLESYLGHNFMQNSANLSNINRQPENGDRIAKPFSRASVQNKSTCRTMCLAATLRNNCWGLHLQSFGALCCATRCNCFFGCLSVCFFELLFCYRRLNAVCWSVTGRLICFSFIVDQIYTSFIIEAILDQWIVTVPNWLNSIVQQL